MVKKLINLINLKRIISSNKLLLSNIASLSIVQFIVVLFPLITLPYVVRVLGPANYGKVSFILAVIIYLSLIIDFGFNLTGVREISVNRENKEKLNQIFSSIFYSKIFLSLITLGIFFITLFSYQILQKDIDLYLIALLYLTGNIFNTSWLYQGLEKSYYLVGINLIPRMIGIILIFTLVKTEFDDIYYVAILSSINLVVGIISFVHSLSKIKVRLYNSSISNTTEQIKSSWKIFLSNMSINIYTNSNLIILGLLTAESNVGIYSAADKIRLAIQSVFGPVSQSVFAKVNHILQKSSEHFFNFNRKLVLIQSVLTLIISVCVYYYSEELVLIILGKEYLDSVIVLKILCWLPFIISISNVYGIQILLSLRKDKKFLNVVIFAAILSIILSLILTSYYKEIGTAITILIIEIFVSVSMLYLYKTVVRKNEI